MIASLLNIKIHVHMIDNSNTEIRGSGGHRYINHRNWGGGGGLYIYGGVKGAAGGRG